MGDRRKLQLESKEVTKQELNTKLAEISERLDRLENLGGIAEDNSGLDTDTKEFIHYATISTTFDVMIWRANYPCAVVGIYGYRAGGTSASINVSKNGYPHLPNDLSLSTADTWLPGGPVQNPDYAVGDTMEVNVTTVVGNPTALGVQVRVRRNP